MSLKDLMGYEYAICFPRARDALMAWCGITGKKIKIPSNCCHALLPFASEIVPIDPATGLAPVPVQLYGYRQEFPGAELEIDTLMTGLLGRPFAQSTIVSFGYAKTIDIGGGGAILTNDKSLADELVKFSFWPPILTDPFSDAIRRIYSIIMEKKEEYESIERWAAPFVNRLPTRPVIPWRFVAKIRKKSILNDARRYGYKVSHNYPPLPGVTDDGAFQFGREVINIWR